jgi:hypothetical protein
MSRLLSSSLAVRQRALSLSLFLSLSLISSASLQSAPDGARKKRQQQKVLRAKTTHFEVGWCSVRIWKKRLFLEVEDVEEEVAKAAPTMEFQF